MEYIEKIQSTLPNLDIDSVKAINELIKRELFASIDVLNLDSEKLNLISVNTDKLPHIRAEEKVKSLASAISEKTGGLVNCIFCSSSHGDPITVQSFEKGTAYVIEIPLSHISKSAIDRLMIPYKEVESALVDSGYDVKFIPKRHHD